MSAIDKKRQHWLDADDNEVYASELRTAAAVYISELETKLAAETQRADKAEAELEAPWHIGRFIEVDGLVVGPHMVRSYRERVDALGAELEALKCCVICRHMRWIDDANYCDEKPEWDMMVGWYDPCQFTPSRWTPREAAE